MSDIPIIPKIELPEMKPYDPEEARRDREDQRAAAGAYHKAEVAKPTVFSQSEQVNGGGVSDTESVDVHKRRPKAAVASGKVIMRDTSKDTTTFLATGAGILAGIETVEGDVKPDYTGINGPIDTAA